MLRNYEDYKFKSQLNLRKKQSFVWADGLPVAEGLPALSPMYIRVCVQMARYLCERNSLYNDTALADQ